MFSCIGNLQFNVFITFSLRHIWNKMSYCLLFAEYNTEWIRCHMMHIDLLRFDQDSSYYGPFSSTAFFRE